MSLVSKAASKQLCEIGTILCYKQTLNTTPRVALCIPPHS